MSDYVSEDEVLRLADALEADPETDPKSERSRYVTTLLRLWRHHRAHLRRIDETLNGIESVPEMYGGPEAVELQYVSALEDRASLLGQSRRRVRNEWMRAANLLAGHDTNRPMFACVSRTPEGLAALVAGLKDLRRVVVSDEETLPSLGKDEG